MQESIALTWSTLNARMKNIRAGAACAALAVLASLLSAIFIRSGWCLAGLPVLMLVGYAFSRRDLGLVYRWENAILESWDTTDLCMGILVRTFRDYPGPLSGTMKAMVAQLPPNPDFLKPASDAIKAERALFYARSGMQQARMTRAALLHIALSSLPLCAWICFRHDPRLLPLALIPLGLVPPLRSLILARETKRLRARCETLAPWNPKTVPDLIPRLEALEAAGLPRGTREAWAKAVAEAE
jgi:hypothetical protein